MPSVMYKKVGYNCCPNQCTGGNRLTVCKSHQGGKKHNEFQQDPLLSDAST